MVIEAAEGDTHVTVDTSTTALGAGVGGEEDVEQQAPGEVIPEEGVSVSDKAGRGKRARRPN